jgi:hypothetical protein
MNYNDLLSRIRSKDFDSINHAVAVLNGHIRAKEEHVAVEKLFHALHAVLQELKVPLTSPFFLGSIISRAVNLYPASLDKCLVSLHLILLQVNCECTVSTTKQAQPCYLL